MGHIAPRPRTRVELLHTAKQVAHQPRRQRPFRRGDVFLPQQYRERIRDRALLDDECAVHVGLAQSQFGIEQDCALGFGVGKANGDRRAAAVAECVSFARGRCDSERPWRINRRIKISIATDPTSPPHSYVRRAGRDGRRIFGLGSAALRLIDCRPAGFWPCRH